MKAAIVSGSWPPERCGVGDYSAQLVRHLEEIGIDVAAVTMDDWSTLRALGYRRVLNDLRPDVVHVQYPAVGYGRSLLPALTPFLQSGTPLVVTLHEYSLFKPYRRPWFAPYAARAVARLFSRQAECEAFAAAFPRRRGKDHVVAIGSNIPAGTAPARARRIVFFGLFWPGKGLDRVFDLAEAIRSGAKALELHVVGAPVSGFPDYAAQIRARCRDLGITLHEGLPPEAVADLLAGSRFAYLPFPEGADERRGSLAAVVVNGCITFTGHGAQTPDWLKEATVGLTRPSEVLQAIEALLAQPDAEEAMRDRVRLAARRYDWTAIAERHVEIYREAMSLRRSRAGRS